MATPDFNVSGDYYIKPYIRLQPYLVGILFGYILFKIKDKKIKIPHVSKVITKYVQAKGPKVPRFRYCAKSQIFSYSKSNVT